MSEKPNESNVYESCPAEKFSIEFGDIIKTQDAMREMGDFIFRSSE